MIVTARISSMDGVLVIDKPAGMTSHDVVDVVRKKLRTRRVGHAGTLDPDATGVLVVGVGKATRLLSYVQHAPKTYRAEALFGVTTTTQDASGEIVRDARPVALERGEVRAAMEALTGDIEQVPPMVSAVKIGGEALYKKARRGEEVTRAPRPVTIYSLTMIDFEPGDAPRARFEVRCSAGTYVRTLIHDLGAAAGCGAHVVSLRRIEAGGFSADDAIALENVDAKSLLPLREAVRVLPAIEVSADDARLISHGRTVEVPALPEEGDPGEPAPVHDVAVVHDNDLVGVCRREENHLIPATVIPR